MKYIRTKDEIYSLEKATICRYKNKEYVCPIRREETFEEHRSREHQFISSKWEVIKTADTIEELCDEKVAIRKSNHKPYLGHFSGPYYFLEDTGWLGRVDSYEIIYGAIWTDKGLIYVAKMNEKGELELL